MNDIIDKVLHLIGKAERSLQYPSTEACARAVLSELRNEGIVKCWLIDATAAEDHISVQFVLPTGQFACIGMSNLFFSG